MWRLVETIRNKSTILKSRKLNMERIGQPSTIHMEIIEEEVEKEGYGTEFKRGKAGKMIWSDNSDDGENGPAGGAGAQDQKSNKSSPVKQNVNTVEKNLNPDTNYNGCLELIQQKVVANNHYLDDSNVDPPSKSEPPSALFFDEPLSSVFFNDLESPAVNHPPLRSQLYQPKYHDETLDQPAEAIELNENEKIFNLQAEDHQNHFKGDHHYEVMKYNNSKLASMVSVPQGFSNPSSRLNKVYLVQTSAPSAQSHVSQNIEALKHSLMEKISEIQCHRQLAQKFDCNPDISQSSVAMESAKMSMVSGRISIQSMESSAAHHRQRNSNLVIHRRSSQCGTTSDGNQILRNDARRSSVVSVISNNSLATGKIED